MESVDYQLHEAEERWVLTRNGNSIGIFPDQRTALMEAERQLKGAGGLVSLRLTFMRPTEPPSS